MTARMNKQPISYAIRLWRKGYSNLEIAPHVGRTEAEVYNWMAKYRLRWGE